MIFRQLAVLFVTLVLATSVLSLDNEYCSLNLTQDECITQTTNTNCCWLQFTHQNGYGRDIIGCFEVEFMVNSLKFVYQPKTYTSVTDSQLCTALGTTCNQITKANFNAVFSQVPNYTSFTLISNVSQNVCHA
jgi:hypothetical protein